MLLLVFKIQNTLALDDLCAQLFISGIIAVVVDDEDEDEDENNEDDSHIVYDTKCVRSEYVLDGEVIAINILVLVFF